MLSTKCEKLYALADCNNFYASCEALFRPDLKEAPLVVLSNNDGCIVSRSKKAKELGIPMGLPLYQQMDFLKKNNVQIFSSNYPLYGDISQRVMAVFEGMCPEVEQYSIDEAFLTFTPAMACNAEEVAKEIRDRVQKWVGITLSLGVAPTRTLAKVANHIAKKKESGVEIFSYGQDIDSILEKFPIKDVWGIGRKSALKCRVQNIYTALDLKNADKAWIRKTLNVTGYQTALELAGQPCYSSEDQPAHRQSILYSRSFGEKVHTKEELEEATSAFAVQAGVKLRKTGLYAARMSVYVASDEQQSRYKGYASAEFHFPAPTQDSLDFLKAVPLLLSEIYKEKTSYVKSGVMLYDLHTTANIQLSLLDTPKEDNPLFNILDTINHRYGRHSIAFGAEGSKNATWKGKQKRCSPQFTTKWTELKEVK